jgi:aspartate ammonia-lyase
MEQIITLLSSCQAFKNAAQDDLKALASQMTLESFAPGDILHHEGHARENFGVINSGNIDISRIAGHREHKTLITFGRGDIISEGLLVEESYHTTTAKCHTAVTIYQIPSQKLSTLLDALPKFKVRIIENLLKQLLTQLNPTKSSAKVDILELASGKTRTEHDLLGDREVPDYAYFGIQTLRAQDNFYISGEPLHRYPELIFAFAQVKKAAAMANADCDVITQQQRNSICAACDELLKGKLHQQFTLDMLQGGAGTSTNMNANEVIANRALELMGYQRGDYQHCHPNNHVNASQSTNDAYPTALHLAMLHASKYLCDELAMLTKAFEQKAAQFNHIIKMGRTQLQDAVPMTLGQEFQSFARSISSEINTLTVGRKALNGVNMGGTAIGTGLNTPKGYSQKVIKYLRETSNISELYLAEDLVEATQSTQGFVIYSAVVKSLAIKLSKICNDLRLLSSGPRAGFGEIRLPAMQPGSSIMPGKVNPVIPEVVNQVCYKVIGNDLTVTLASEAGQLQLNVMEPVIAQAMLESIHMLINASVTLRKNCIVGIEANESQCNEYVEKSIGVVTAVVPVLGYEVATSLAKEALETGQGIVELIRVKGLLDEQQIADILSPANMTGYPNLT